MRKEKISVCMATYNGSLYIEEQINSIIAQFIEGDELIVVDDGSSDDTVNIIKAINDDKIKLYINEINMGVNRNFEKAIGLVNNEYIFLADQDDIWNEGRVEIMMERLKEENVDVVAGNIVSINKNGELLDYDFGTLYKRNSQKKIKNIGNVFFGTAYYYGCAMALKSSCLKAILPFPTYLESHDLWIAMSAILRGTISHIEENVLYRRVHGENASIVRRAFGKKIRSRWIFVKSLFELSKRNRVYK